MTTNATRKKKKIDDEGCPQEQGLILSGEAQRG
jgi:hypothetical protein